MNAKQGHIVAAAVLGVAGLLSGSSANAALNYSTGFEVAQGFPLNSALPQAGWTRQDGTAVPLPTMTTPAVINGPSAAGVQTLRIQNQGPFVPNQQANPNSVSYAISPVASLPGANNLVLSGMPLVHIQWDMRVDDGADIDETSDTWALDVYDSTGNNRTVSVARSAIAAIPGGAPTTSFIYSTLPNSSYNPSPIGIGPASGAWGVYDLDLNYITKTYTLMLNGSPLGGGLFNVASDNGLDVNFTVNGRGIDTAYFDNISVVATPEPGSIGLAGIASVGLLARRRRASK